MKNEVALLMNIEVACPSAVALRFRLQCFFGILNNVRLRFHHGKTSVMDFFIFSKKVLTNTILRDMMYIVTRGIKRIDLERRRTWIFNLNVDYSIYVSWRL